MHTSSTPVFSAHAGRVEPVSAGVDAGVRLGLGKQEEDDKYTSADGITRKKLESEIQADEDPERTKRREVGAAERRLRLAQLQANLSSCGMSVLAGSCQLSKQC
jgi:hypothetical protein